MSPQTLSYLAISKVVTFTSTYDHRTIIQGAESGAFLGHIEELLLGQREFYEEGLRRPRDLLQALATVDVNPAFSGDGRSGEIAKQARVLELINAYRVRGHLIADIDPLRDRPADTPGARPDDLRPDDLGPRPHLLDGRFSRRRPHAAARLSSA